MVKGRVHSCESFGTVDGPGIRYVVFLQGCPMRCLYCHNPDTWNMAGGEERTARSLISEYEKNAAFYKNGGITVTGGEPLLQVDFLIELFELAKGKGIHTCIDTSGVTYDPKNAVYMAKLDKLMSLTDLVMLDIKHIDSVEHKRLTGRGNENILAFAEYLSERGIPLWVRHVVVTGYTDKAEDHRRLGEFLATLKSLKALDVLPYHSMGETKYRELGMEYALSGVAPLTVSEAEAAKHRIIEGMKSFKKNITK